MCEVSIEGLQRELYYQIIEFPEEKLLCFCRVLTEEGFEPASELFAGTELQDVLCDLHKEHRAVAEERVAVEATRVAIESQWVLWQERCHQPGI